MVVKKIKKTIISFLLLFTILPFFQPYDLHTTSAEAEEISVGVPTLNVRKGPGLSYSVVGQASKGENYKIIDKDGDWYKIESGSLSGWVANWLVLEAEGSEESSSESSIGTVTTSSLRVRESPSEGSSILGILQKGETVNIIGSISGWYEIKYNSGNAWVSEEYIQITSASKDDSQSSSSSSADYGTITVHSLNVRSDNTLNGEVIAKVEKGDKYPIVEENNNWYKIELSDGSKGWVAGWYVEKTVANIEEPEEHSLPESKNESNSNSDTITILYNGTNLRAEADTSSKIVRRANSGETFSIVEQQGDWFAIELEDGNLAYVASWVVSTTSTDDIADSSEADTHNSTSMDKVVVLDPGHGGVDSGTIGIQGTLEKALTLNTANLVNEKLQNAGIKVIMTRRNDQYLSLPSRVGLSHYYGADAFISIHYDSISTSSVVGHTTYYYHNYQKSLANSIHNHLANSLTSKDRGVRYGDYHVIRENKQPAVLLELGFLSNAAEEANVNTPYFQEMAANAISQGIDNYLSD
jgi:N-acetylmuramoyl-L-alanine amidase